MREFQDTTAELIEEMRRIGRGLRTNRHPTYDFAASLFRAADRMQFLEEKATAQAGLLEQLSYDHECCDPEGCRFCIAVNEEDQQ